MLHCTLHLVIVDFNEASVIVTTLRYGLAKPSAETSAPTAIIRQCVATTRITRKKSKLTTPADSVGPVEYDMRL